MRKPKPLTVWKSKFIDFIIVIIGITIAFQLNNISDSNRIKNKELNYLRSFFHESLSNETKLQSALNFTVSSKKNIDTLNNILILGNYKDVRIKELLKHVTSIADFNPSIVTMENITASGEFQLISDYECRERLIETHNAYKTTEKIEELLFTYVNQYITPFFIKNTRFSNLSSIDDDFIKKIEFENIVIGYSGLLTQKVEVYKTNIEKLKKLNQLLQAKYL